MVSALFKALGALIQPTSEKDSCWPAAKSLLGKMLPSQLLLHLPAQQQGGRLQATLVLGLQPNHTKGLGREAPCSGTWQSGLQGGREEMALYGTGGDGSSHPQDTLQIPGSFSVEWHIPAAQPGMLP